jgi:hypothetical protein
MRFHQALSSIYILAADNFSIASHIFANSSSSSSHFDNFQESIHIALAIILSVSCSLLISKLKIAIFLFANQIF